MNRLKNDFIATVTHELKTPLSSMRLLVDTLLEGNYRDEQTVPEYLGLIANENERLSHLIDSFLTFSRMERNKQVFEIAPVSPVEVAKQAAEAVRTKFDNGNVTFEMDIQKALPMIHADKDGMITVLVNLLDNAYKYSNSDKQIQLNVYQQNGIICFAVKDNGIGISKRVQKRIFNRFYQVDSRLSRTAEGCGLGLSIVKFVVDAHKGTIDVESQPGQGSTFRVKLPQC
ncbi:MAG: sensor histidine kinase [Planctomycetota bacterium]